MTKAALRQWDCPNYYRAGRGIVDEYVDPNGPGRVHTIQLADGTAPHGHEFDGVLMRSNGGRVTAYQFLVTHGWYRPTRAQLDNECLSCDRAHVLNGGLLLAPLEKAVSLNMRAHPEWPDPATDWPGFVEAAYGIKPSTYGKGAASDATLKEFFQPDTGGEGGGA